MIASLEGKILHRENGMIIVDVGGVGYKVSITADTEKSLKKEGDKPIKIFTYLAVRENALDLYGFQNRKDLMFFELLISISGIGPKSALAILSIASVETLERAVSAGDSSYLTQVSGIGKKNAEKIVLELENKLGSITDEVGSALMKDEADTLEALKALGYGLKESRDALKKVSKEITDTGSRIKEVLKLLGNGK